MTDWGRAKRWSRRPIPTMSTCGSGVHRKSGLQCSASARTSTSRRCHSLAHCIASGAAAYLAYRSVANASSGLRRCSQSAAGIRTIDVLGSFEQVWRAGGFVGAAIMWAACAPPAERSHHGPWAPADTASLRRCWTIDRHRCGAGTDIDIGASGRPSRLWGRQIRIGKPLKNRPLHEKCSYTVPCSYTNIHGDRRLWVSRSSSQQARTSRPLFRRWKTAPTCRDARHASSH